MNASPRPEENASLDALDSMDARAREIFRRIVQSYLDTGDPTGSRTLSQQLSIRLSPATIRNVMQDLESLGLIYAPHTSAGRLPTDLGMRFFIDGFLEIGRLSESERKAIEAQFQAASESRTMEHVLAEASQLLSGLSHSAGLVVASKSDLSLRHIEFVRLDASRALAVIVGENGMVENRVIDLPAGVTASTLVEAANYINANIAGRTIPQARAHLGKIREALQGELDELARKLVDAGVAVWAGGSEEDRGQLIVSGHGNLLGDPGSEVDLDRLRQLFGDLEAKENFMRILELAEEGEGVRIFIGSENRLFSLSGSSVVVAPYRDKNERVVGALGIIGPMRMNYAHIVPVVDFTAQIVSRMMR